MEAKAGVGEDKNGNLSISSVTGIVVWE